MTECDERRHDSTERGAKLTRPGAFARNRRRIRPPGIGKVYAVVLLGAVFFSVATYSLVQLNRERDSIAQVTRTSIWIATQLEIELLRFRNVLDRYRAGIDDLSADEVKLRFDILWSRVPIARSGIEAGWLRAAPNAKPELDALTADLARFDPLIQGLETTDTAALSELARVIGSHIGKFHDIVIEMHVGEHRQSLVSEISASQWKVTVALAALVAVGGVIVVLLLVAIRANNRAAQREREMRLQAERSDIAKSRFLLNMSHELRTPLNAILGFSDMIQQQILGGAIHPKYIEYAKDIGSAGSYLLDLVNDILDLSRIESGRVVLDETEFDLGEAIGACVQMVRTRSGGSGPTVALETPDSHLRLHGDERIVRQIAINLLTNALKFTPAEGQIAVSAALADDGGLLLRVCDTGIGIAAEDIPRVLEPFGQVEEPMTKANSGIGLGLPLSRQFTELHGGTLELASEPDVGTTVTVHFPPSRTVRQSETGE